MSSCAHANARIHRLRAPHASTPTPTPKPPNPQTPQPPTPHPPPPHPAPPTPQEKLLAKVLPKPFRFNDILRDTEGIAASSGHPGDWRFKGFDYGDSD